MKILMISSDRKMFDQGSDVRSRLLDYGGIVDELHVIVFTKKTLGLQKETFAHNIFLYPTNALTRFGYIARAIRAGVKIARSGVKFDVITAQDPFEIGFVAYALSRILNARLHIQVHTDHMGLYFKNESPLNRFRVMLSRFVLPRADAVRVVSERIKSALSGVVSRGVPIEVIPVFIDADRIRNTKITQNLKVKYPQFDKIILMASRLSPEKNIQMAIRSMVHVVERYPKAGLIIAGSGKEESSLKKLVNELHLEKNSMFEGWSSDLVSYYKTADVFLLTSNYEGYGMTVAESLLSGTPVVMTDVGCAGDLVQHGINGLVVPVGDEKALERAVMRVVSEGILFEKKEMAFPSKEWYLQKYKKSWQDALAKKV